MTSLTGLGQAQTGAGNGIGAAAPVRRGRKGSLGRRAAAGATATLALAIGITAWAGHRQSRATLVELAEQNGRRNAAGAGNRFGTLESASAANVLATLDIVLDGQLRALAAAVSMLVETAERGGLPPAYIHDALRQLAGRSAIDRIDVAAADGAGYTTGPEALTLAGLPAQLRRLAETPPEGRTAAAAAAETERGLRKQAGAQADHRRLVVVVEQTVDSRGAGLAYRDADGGHGRTQAQETAETLAAVLAHAAELAEDARWGPARIEQKLEAIIAETPVARVEVLGPDGPAVYEAARAGYEHAGRSAGDVAALAELRTGREQGTRALSGHEDAERRWISAAAGSRGSGRLTVAVEIASRTGAGSLVESAWQAEADQLARVDGVEGVWVAVVDGETARLAAAAPRPGTGIDPAADAWTAWGGEQRRAALDAAADETAAARSAAHLGWTGGGDHVLSAAVAGRRDSGERIVVVLRTDAGATGVRLRHKAATTAWSALLLISVLGAGASIVTRRLVTNPVGEIAEAARCLAGGIEPSARVQTLVRRNDEVGALAEDFSDMTEQVLARAGELEQKVGEKTRWLRDANGKLRSAQARMAKEVALAKTVQGALVPSGNRRCGRLALTARMEPARDLGGDFVTIDDPQGGYVTVSACDVSGKGVAAALFMVCAQGAVSTAARRSNDVSEIAAEANRRLCDGNELAMFVTGIIARIDTRSGRIEYVCAGHDPAIVVGADGRLDRLERTGGIPLGIEDDHIFEKRSRRLTEGETLVIYTDGVTDACNAENEGYGEERLDALLHGAHTKSTEEIVHDIWTSVELFCARAAAFDDKTVLVVRHTGQAKRRSGAARTEAA